MKERELFGTDGIRGKANIYPMTCEIALNLGRVVTYFFQKRSITPLVIIGKDTRRSCYMLEQAIAAGVCSQGGSVVLTGPLPTPAVSFLTRSMRADSGIMISASHNPYSDNGIKIFDSFGEKLSDKVESELEYLMNNLDVLDTKINHELGKAKRLREVFGRYIVKVKSAFSSEYNLDGIRIVLDCANGAGYQVAPMVFEELGAEVMPLGVNPNGININEKSGALYPEKTTESISLFRADCGICLDGDADRVVIVDRHANNIQGDRLIALFAKFLLDQSIIKKGDVIVGTVMSNYGLEKYIESIGLKFIRSQVGDRYILEEMKKYNSLLGGEPSGHIIFKKYSATGDGIISGLKYLEAVKYYGDKLDSLLESVYLYPHKIKNLNIEKKIPIAKLTILQKELKKTDALLKGNGRQLIRYSGTENKVRIMVESKDMKLVDDIIKRLSSSLLQSLNSLNKNL